MSTGVSLQTPDGTRTAHLGPDELVLYVIEVKTTGQAIQPARVFMAHEQCEEAGILPTTLVSVDLDKLEVLTLPGGQAYWPATSLEIRKSDEYPALFRLAYAPSLEAVVFMTTGEDDPRVHVHRGMNPHLLVPLARKALPEAPRMLKGIFEAVANGLEELEDDALAEAVLGTADLIDKAFDEEVEQFMRGYREGARLGTLDEAKESWAAWSRQLSDPERARLEDLGFEQGYAEGKRMLDECSTCG